MSISATSLDSFVNKYTDKTIDIDGAYGGQCVDLYRQYCKEVLAVPQSPGVIGASDIWDTYLKDHFDRIENTPTNIPQVGDIVIWNEKAGGGFGHVAIFLKGTTKSFHSFDQNFPTGSKCRVVSHHYNNVLGWLTPKKIVPPVAEPEKIYTEAQMTEMRLERDTNYNEAQARKKDFEAFTGQLAEKLTLPTTADRSDILAAIDRLLTVEESKRVLEKKLDQEQKQHDQETNNLIDKIGKLKAAVEKQQNENKLLLIRADELEKQVEKQGEKAESISFLSGLLEGLNNLFKKEV